MSLYFDVKYRNKLSAFQKIQRGAMDYKEKREVAYMNRCMKRGLSKYYTSEYMRFDRNGDMFKHNKSSLYYLF